MNSTVSSHEHVHESFELHVVSTGVGNQASFVKAAKDVWPWVDYIHIREKQLSWQDKIGWAESLRSVGVPSCRIVINGSELPPQNDIYGGVHWGQDAIRNYNPAVISNMQRLRLGVSVHSIDEAKIAEERGADYLSSGMSTQPTVSLILNQEDYMLWLKCALLSPFLSWRLGASNRGTFTLFALQAHRESL